MPGVPEVLPVLGVVTREGNVGLQKPGEPELFFLEMSLRKRNKLAILRSGTKFNYTSNFTNSQNFDFFIYLVTI